MTFNKENLLRLADYLESLPEDYEHFEMRSYLEGGDFTKYEQYALYNGGVAATTCGAVACAVGHGPSAGLPLIREELIPDFDWDEFGKEFHYLNPDWTKYSTRVFCDIAEHAKAYQYMFGGIWTNIDNTPWGAAARIRMVCDIGPEVDMYDRDKFYVGSDQVERYAPYHKNNRPKPTLAQRVVAFLKG